LGNGKNVSEKHNIAKSLIQNSMQKVERWENVSEKHNISKILIQNSMQKVERLEKCIRKTQYSQKSDTK